MIGSTIYKLNNNNSIHMRLRQTNIIKEELIFNEYVNVNKKKIFFEEENDNIGKWLWINEGNGLTIQLKSTNKSRKINNNWII